MEANISLYHAIVETKNKYPNNNALLFMGKYVNYQEMIDKIDLVANGFYSLGLKKGDVVTMALPNVFEAVYAFYATIKLGVIGHMVHPVTPVNQMKKFMKETNSRILLVMDTFFDHYKSLLTEGIKIILVSPVLEFGFVKKIGYRILNNKKLRNIKYNDSVLSFKKLYKTSPKAQAAEIDSKTTATYLHSGGTSGQPKTIELSHYAINYLAGLTSYVMDCNEFSNKHMLAVLPMFHGFGLCMGIHGMLLFGGVNTLMPKFNVDEAVNLIKSNQINYVIGVPSLFEAFLRHPDFSNPLIKNLDQAYVGGDYVALDLKKRFDKAMEKVGSKARLLEGYGLTEVVTVCSVNTLKEHNQKSVGKPLPGIKVAIVNHDTLEFLPANKDGEIVVSGPTVMNGYLNDSEATKATIFNKDNTQWVFTGDLGYIDDLGYVHFKQRLKRIIKVLGIPVLPAEIENLMMSYESVSEVAAIGIHDDLKGNMVKLFIVWEPTKEKLKEEEIREIIKSELGPYAVPKMIVELEELPKTAIGKTDILTLEKM